MNSVTLGVSLLSRAHAKAALYKPPRPALGSSPSAPGYLVTRRLQPAPLAQELVSVRLGTQMV